MRKSLRCSSQKLQNRFILMVIINHFYVILMRVKHSLIPPDILNVISAENVVYHRERVKALIIVYHIHDNEDVWHCLKRHLIFYYDLFVVCNLINILASYNNKHPSTDDYVEIYMHTQLFMASAWRMEKRGEKETHRSTFFGIIYRTLYK